MAVSVGIEAFPMRRQVEDRSPYELWHAGASVDGDPSGGNATVEVHLPNQPQWIWQLLSVGIQGNTSTLAYLTKYFAYLQADRSFASSITGINTDANGYLTLADQSRLLRVYRLIPCLPGAAGNYFHLLFSNVDGVTYRLNMQLARYTLSAGQRPMVETWS